MIMEYDNMTINVHMEFGTQSKSSDTTEMFDNVLPLRLSISFHGVGLGARFGSTQNAPTVHFHFKCSSLHWGAQLLVDTC